MSISQPSVTVWNRLEPRPRSPSFKASLSAELRDPLWLLTRQWQVGEFQGEDAGSPAFVQYSLTSSDMTGWVPAATPDAAPVPMDPGMPLERQVLSEAFPFSLTLRVEIGQTFELLLESHFGSDTARVIAAFKASSGYLLAAPVEDPFNPIDLASVRFLRVCAGRALDGKALLELVAAGSLPDGVASNASEEASIRAALTELAEWVESTYGRLGDADPSAWRPELIEYGIHVGAVTPAGEGATLLASPDESGEFQWSSFDALGPAAASGAPRTETRTLIPMHVKFMGMPAPRFWDFETSELSYADVTPDKKDVIKTLVADFMLVHGIDWFEFGVELAAGSLARVDYIVVSDVFGERTLVERADQEVRPSGASRWTMFSNTRVASAGIPAGVGDFFVVSPSAGLALVKGPALEEVRFARDEMANMAFGVERSTMSPLGQPRLGSERNAAVDQRLPLASTPPPDTTAPLHYVIESKVPVQYIPLVAVPLSPGDADNPAIILEKAAIVRPNADGSYTALLAQGRILNPDSLGAGTPYQILEEQIPRAGVTVQRAIYRARWSDGSTQLWLARRKQTGAGETQTGLRFDAALPVET